MPDRATNPVKSAMRTLDIVEYVVARGTPVVAQEIAAALNIPISSLSYLLNTLVERDYLARDRRRYSPGRSLARLRTRTDGFPLEERAAPLVRSLRMQLNETVSFFVVRDWEVEALVTETSDHALRYAVRIGSRMPLHGFAAGKAILAAMPDAEIATYLDRADLVAFTPATITDRAALLREVATIRETGIARTCEEYTPGIQGIARAITTDGEPIGAFSVAIPTVRFDAEVERRTSELLVRTCGLLLA